MGTIQWHDAQVRTRDLGSRLRVVVSRHADRLDADRVLGLLGQDGGERPRLVLTGQFSSGKSSVIKALTDGQAHVQIAVDIATDRVTDYDWDGAVILTDTPGVQAGMPLHDQLAKDAIARADLVLFVITVELLDDEAAVHLRDVAGEFGKSSQTLVLINKAGSMKGDPEMRRRAVIEAWGPDYPEPPVLQCDAADYLTSLSHSDPIRAEQYRATSGIPQLREAIDLFALERGDLARLQQPLQAIRTAATEAQSALADDPEEAAVLALLARQRRALTTRRQRIETLLETIQVRFLDQCLGASEVFADSVESVDEEIDEGVRGRVVDEAQVRLRADLDIAAESFGDSITNAVVHQMEDLASEVLEIEASPHSRVVLDLPVDKTRVDVMGGDVPQAPNGAAVAAATSGRGWMEEVMGALNWFNDSWGAGGGVRESAGTLGHQVVKDVGHLFDVKFKPWQAVRVANYIGKAAKVASVAIPVVLAGVSVVQEDAAARRAESARHARRQRLITEVHTQARQISDSALNSARQQLDRPFSAAYDRIDEATRSITESQGARSDSVRELNSIRGEAGEALARLEQVGVGAVGP